MVQLQDSLLECLDHITFFNMFYDMISKAHRVQILSCFGPRASACFTTQPVFLAFQLSSPIFSRTFQTQFGLPIPQLQVSPQCVCTHPFNPMGIHFLHCNHHNECIRTHDVICDTFVAIV